MAVWGRSVPTEARIAWPEGPAPPELTGHGEGGEEGGLDWLRLRGWRRGRRRLLLRPLRVFRVFCGNVPVFDVFVSPVLKRLAAHAVRRVDQSLPLCGQEARQTARRVTDCCTVVLSLTCTQPFLVSRTHP